MTGAPHASGGDCCGGGRADDHHDHHHGPHGADHKGHDHHHGHGHAHHGHGAADERSLTIAFALTSGFMVAEVIGGLLSGSLALIADAGHMLSDTFALGLAIFAMRLTRRPADTRRSYGYRRVQVLAAFVNALLLIGLSALIIIEAVERLFAPAAILAGPMLIIACLGLVVNIVSFALLHGGASRNLSMKGASLHVLADLFGSVAAIAAGLIVLTTGWTGADPLLSLIVVALILRGTVPMLRTSAHILLEGTPSGYQSERIAARLKEALPQIKDVHHVHVWSLDGNDALITLHVAIADDARAGAVLTDVKAVLAADFGLTHATIQIEGEACHDRSHALAHA